MNNLSRWAPHVAAAALFFGLAAVYFYPQLEGKLLVQSDMIQYMGMSQEVREYHEATGERSLWTNAMFGGMPTYQINTISDGNLFRPLHRLINLWLDHPIGQFFSAMLCFYILLLAAGLSPWLGIIGAIAFGITTNSVILYEAGHISKLRALAYLPLVAAGVVVAFHRRVYLGGALLFGLGLGLNLLANHVQMTYYFFISLLVYGVAQLVFDLRQGQGRHFVKASGALALAGLLAIGSSASNLWVTYEYSKDTMRGEPILQAPAPDATAQPASSSATEGLAWDYAMQWSNGPIDLFASLIPGVAGGGSQEPVKSDSPLAQELAQLGVNPQNLKLPLYWGALPFTSGPIYFGAAIFLLFLLGLFLVKGPLRWWLGISVLLTFALSMGKHFEPFNRLMFEYFPIYNKFRTPNSVLTVTSLLVPVLAMLGVQRFLSEHKSISRAREALYWSMGITGGIALFFALLGPSFFEFQAPRDAQFQQAGQAVMDALIEERKSLMRRDAWRTLFFVAASGALLWAYSYQRLKMGHALLGLAALFLIDLWAVGRRYLQTDEFVGKVQYQEYFRPRPIDEEIMADSDPHYRVLDLTIPTFESARSSYFHKTIGGYHAAKLQRYQDLIDRHLSRGNLQVFNMLNTKYVIQEGPDKQPLAAPNPEALGNVWFVERYRLVSTPDEEIEALNDFDPAVEAIAHESFREYLQGLSARVDTNATIRLEEYRPNRLSYLSNSVVEQLAVFSEIWYGPDKGWQAYIDGQPAEHIRVNYALRAMRVPAGEHRIEFRFEPRAYQKGVLVSRLCSSLLILAALGYGGREAYRLFNQPAAPTPPPAPEKTTPRVAPPPAGQRKKIKGKGKSKK
jgi:hypothetical protein